MHDTFYFDDGRVKTHTSPVQVDHSEPEPPIRIVAQDVFICDSD